MFSSRYSEFHALWREKHIHFGVTANTFKERFRNHKKSFTNVKYANETELSKLVWKHKRGKRDYNIKWSLLKHAPAGKGNSRQRRSHGGDWGDLSPPASIQGHPRDMFKSDMKWGMGTMQRPADSLWRTFHNFIQGNP